jgi:hypothetical protein
MTKQVKRSSFCIFRLNKETAKLLQEIIESFGIAHGKVFTNDSFTMQLVSTMRIGDASTLDIYYY